MVVFKFEEGSVSIQTKSFMVTGKTKITGDKKFIERLLEAKALTGGVLAINNINGYVSKPSDIYSALGQLGIKFKMTGAKFTKTILKKDVQY